MAGNEIEITKFLIQQTGKLNLKHVGLVKEITSPIKDGQYALINDIESLKFVSTEQAGKKADIYINGKGISLKQSGGSFPFNRLQRAELLNVFKYIKSRDPEEELKLIDKEVDDFHNGKFESRSRPWQNFFDEDDFRKLVKFLMMDGSPNLGISNFPADFILEAPEKAISESNISIYTFDEYFDWFKKNIYFAIRRQWIGQLSHSEHNRALSIAKKPGNKKWVYPTISGLPRKNKKTNERWRSDIEENDRRTVYMIFIEKK